MKRKENELEEKLYNAIENLSEQKIREYEDLMQKEEPHTFSKDYDIKMNQIFEKGTRHKAPLYVRAIKKAAVFLLIIGALVVTNQVSAQVFSVNPWKIIVNKVSGMKTTTYEKVENKEAVTKKKVSNVPTFIPEGYAQRELKDAKDDVVATWQNEKKKEICYSQLRIVDGMISKIKEGADGNETVNISKYKADVIYEGRETRLDWNDEKYTYFLYSDGLTKEELIKMAESLYQGGTKNE